MPTEEAAGHSLEPQPEDICFQVFFPSGSETQARALPGEMVHRIREAVEKERPPPAACLTKLFQAGKLLLDTTPVADLEVGQPIFAVVARETRLEVLLQAAGSCHLYEKMLGGSELVEPRIRTVGPAPCILDVLEEMVGQPPEVADLHRAEVGAPGTLQYSGRQGRLLLPSLDAAPLLRQHGAQAFEKVTICVEVNSDAFNNGLGVVLEASPLMDGTVDERGLPTYIYNGYGLSKDKRQNAVKFHPGMFKGQLRVEGTGGWGNQSVGFTPAGWTASGRRFHKLWVTLGADGSNCVRFEDPDGKVWSRNWTRQLTEGKHVPAVHAWMDTEDEHPLYVGQIMMQFHMPE
uniref:Ubiquitin-like domain-containing protein n=1 Tax=Alexandrium catenella TaxID=2925 RepID=A0A7S1LL57_ALECA